MKNTTTKDLQNPSPDFLDLARGGLDLNDPYNQVPEHIPYQGTFLYRNAKGTWRITPEVSYKAELIYPKA